MKKLTRELITLVIVLLILAGVSTFVFRTELGTTILESALVDTFLNQIIPGIFELLILFIVFKLLYYICVSFIYDVLIKKLVNEIQYLRARKLIVFGWWTIFAILAIFIMVEDAATLIASAGLVGLGLTFALQKPIMNFVGWLVIVFQNVYVEGDRIQIGDVRGDVIEIQVMNTVLNGLLETGDLPSHKVVTVPNELVLTSDVENYTKDSNYILEELIINITYESDYHNAVEILNKVIQKTITNNIKAYIKKKEAEQLRINKVLDSLVHKTSRSKLEKEGIDIATELKKLESLAEEFKPKVRVEMSSSSIDLVARFLTPYDQIKRTRSAINLAFLDAIANKDENIEIAYPHMQIVYNQPEGEKHLSRRSSATKK